LKNRAGSRQNAFHTATGYHEKNVGKLYLEEDFAKAAHSSASRKEKKDCGNN